MVVRDTEDHLLDEHGLADAGAAEQADLSTLNVRGQEVDALDSDLEDLGLGLEFVEGRSRTVDRPPFGDLQLLAVGEVEAVTSGVPHVVLSHVSDGNGDRRAGVDDFLSPDKAVGRLQRHGADQSVAQVKPDLEGQLPGSFGQVH